MVPTTHKKDAANENAEVPPPPHITGYDAAQRNAFAINFDILRLDRVLEHERRIPKLDCLG